MVVHLPTTHLSYFRLKMVIKEKNEFKVTHTYLMKQLSLKENVGFLVIKLDDWLFWV